MVNSKNNKISLNSLHLTLRPLRISDANQNYLNWMNNPDINKYLESRFTKWTVKKIKNYIQQVKKDRSIIFFAITLKKTGKHIGNIKIGPINRLHGFADIGLIIGEKSCWGKGYATEAIKLVTAHAFKNLKLHKLTAGAYKENIGSIKAFQKSGYVIEGVRAKQYMLETDYTDDVLLAIING